MKIVILSGNLGLFDATAKYTYYLTRTLIDAGHDVLCYTSAIDPQLQLPWAIHAESARLESFKRRIGTWLMRVPMLFDFALRLVGMLPGLKMGTVFGELGQCDVVWIVYASFTRVMSLPTRMKLGPKIRVVLDYQGITPANLVDQRTAAAQKFAIAKLRTLADKCDVLVAHSRFAADELRRNLGSDREVTVIPLFVDPILQKAPVGNQLSSVRSQGDTPRRILCVGRVAPSKRIDILLKAAALLKRKGRRTTITVVGRIDQPYDKERLRLEALALSLKLESDLAFKGIVPTDHLTQLYLQSDVFVSTSAHEGFCFPIIEAMALGLPVVTSNAGALPEVVGDAGLLFDFPSHEDLEAKLIELFSDPLLLRNLAMAGLQRARLFTLENFSRNTSTFVADLERTGNGSDRLQGSSQNSYEAKSALQNH